MYRVKGSADSKEYGLSKTQRMLCTVHALQYLYCLYDTLLYSVETSPRSRGKCHFPVYSVADDVTQSTVVCIIMTCTLYA